LLKEKLTDDTLMFIKRYKFCSSNDVRMFLRSSNFVHGI
jgi:hypothetical protein